MYFDMFFIIQFNATNSRYENLGTIHLLGTLPDSLTKFTATFACMCSVIMRFYT